MSPREVAASYDQTAGQWADKGFNRANGILQHQRALQFGSRRGVALDVGCYADLIEAALPWQPELIFLDPGLEACVANCRRRPFEPHKYRTKEDQDAKLEYLIKWVADYYARDGRMSHAAHQALFDRYRGPKRRKVEQKALI